MLFVGRPNMKGFWQKLRLIQCDCYFIVILLRKTWIDPWIEVFFLDVNNFHSAYCWSANGRMKLVNMNVHAITQRVYHDVQRLKKSLKKISYGDRRVSCSGTLAHWFALIRFHSSVIGMSGFDWSDKWILGWNMLLTSLLGLFSLLRM